LRWKRVGLRCCELGVARSGFTPARDAAPGFGVDAFDSGALGRLVALQERRVVAGLGRGFGKTIFGAVEVEVRIAGERVRFVADRGIDGVKQKVPFAGMGGEVNHQVGYRKLEGVQIKRVARCRFPQSFSGGCQGLAQVERKQRTPARIATQDHPIVPRSHRGEGRRHIEEHHFVDQRGIVVEPAAVHAQDGEAGFHQSGHRVVV